MSTLKQVTYRVCYVHNITKCQGVSPAYVRYLRLDKDPMNFAAITATN